MLVMLINSMLRVESDNWLDCRTRRVVCLQGELHPVHQHHPDPGPEAEVSWRGWQRPITIQVSVNSVSSHVETNVFKCLKADIRRRLLTTTRQRLLQFGVCKWNPGSPVSCWSSFTDNIWKVLSHKCNFHVFSFLKPFVQPFAHNFCFIQLV